MDPITVAYAYDFTPTELRAKSLVVRSPMSQFFEPMITAYVKELNINFRGSLMSSIRGYLAAERLAGSGRTMQEVADTDLTWAWTAAAMSQRRLVATIEFLSYAEFVARLNAGWGRDAEFSNVTMISLEWSPIRMKFTMTSNRFAEINAKVIRLVKDIAGGSKTDAKIDAELDNELVELGPEFDRLIEIKIAEDNAKIDELIDIKLASLKMCSPDEITRSAMRRYWLRYANRFLNNPDRIMFPDIELVTQDEMTTLITKVYESLPETPGFFKNFGLDAEMMQKGIKLVGELAADPRGTGQRWFNMLASQVEKVSITHESPAVQGLLEGGKKMLLDLVKSGFNLSPGNIENIATRATESLSRENVGEAVTSFLDTIQAEVPSEIAKTCQSVVAHIVKNCGGDIKAENVMGEVGNFIEGCMNGDFTNTAFGKMFGDIINSQVRANTARSNSGGLPWWETVGTAPLTTSLEYENALDSAIQGFQEVITRWNTNPPPPPPPVTRMNGDVSSVLQDIKKLVDHFGVSSVVTASVDVIPNDKIQKLLKGIRSTSHTEKYDDLRRQSQTNEATYFFDAALDAEIQELLKDTYVVSHNTDLNDEIQEVKNSHDVNVVTTAPGGSSEAPAGSDRDASDDDSSSCSSCDGCSVCGACCDSDDDSPTPVDPGTPTPVGQA